MPVSMPVLIVVGGFLLLLLMFAVYLNGGAGGGDADEDEHEALPRPTYRERVERHIRLLNYGDDRAAADATRQLLSMGPSILPILLDQLLRLELHPQALSPRSQILIEELLGDFGLQTYLQTAEAVRGVHRASPAFPAVLRVLEGLGPHVVVELCRGVPPDFYGVCAPLILRLGPGCDQQLFELLEASPDEVPAEIVPTFLPLWACEPSLLRNTWDRLSPERRERLTDVVISWNLPDLDDLRREALAGGAVDALPVLAARDPSPEGLRRLVEESRHLAPGVAEQLELLLDAHAQGPSPGDRGAIEESLPLIDSTDLVVRTRGLAGLLTALDDPRAIERLRLLAADPSDTLGGAALAALARGGEPDIEAAFAARVRSAELSLLERVHLHCVAAMRPTQSVPLLVRLLRTESPRTAALVARLLAHSDYPIRSVLKALGRHRYSPIEATIAPLIWARWPTVEAEVTECLDSDDREVAIAAVDLLGGLGSGDCLPALGRRLLAEREEPEPILNALELHGPPAATHLREFAALDPEFARTVGALRRRDLLLRLGD
jgi:hypothetical protein